MVESAQQRVGRQVANTIPFLVRPTTIHSIIIVCLLALSGCASPISHISFRGTRPLVKIGLAAAFEGLDRPLGYEALAGAKLALAERNVAGGIAGYMVELVALNDFSNPQEAYLQAQEFAADPDVLGVVAGWSNKTAHASFPVYNQAGLAVVVPWSVTPELANPQAGVVLVSADIQRVAGVLADAVVAIHPGRVVVVGEEPMAALYAEPMETLGIEVQIVLPPDLLDEESLAEWMAGLASDRMHPFDALVVTTDGRVAGEVLRTMSRREGAASMFGGAETGSAHLISVAGDAATGLVFVSPAPAGVDAGPNLGDDLIPEKSKLAPRAVLAYDATQVLLDAIELAIQKNGYPSRQAVATALAQVHRDGLTGTIYFDVAGRRVDAPVWLYNIAHNQYPGQMLALP